MTYDLSDYDISPIQLDPGVEPEADSTNQATTHYVDAEHIRFYNGKPRKLGGWTSYMFDGNNAISGLARTLYSQRISTNLWLLIGTNTRLYSLLGTTLTNITPVVTSTTAIANSLDTNYGTLANNPITTVNGLTTVTIAYANTNTKLRAGDTITVSGVPGGGVNGVPAAQLNASLFVRSATTTAITVIVATAATSGGSGGSNAVVLATPVITVNQTAHGFSEGDREKILAAANTGGILAAQINTEHLIRAGTANLYYITSADGSRATSSVTAAGGASTTVQGQIAAGAADASSGLGYGLGQYGVGQYGVAKSSAGGLTMPRIWSFDAYGNLIIMTPGGQTGVYNWNGDNTMAPTLLSGAPAAVNYTFTCQNIVVTLGASNTGNRVQWSDQGNATSWTATAQNQAGSIDIQGVGTFLSHAKVSDTINLLFTNNEVVRMTYIGLPYIWQFEIIEQRIGIIGQNARMSLGGIVYWMGLTDYYLYDGAIVGPMPGNTLRQTIFDDINTVQQSKSWMGYMPKYREIWCGYPSEVSNNCDSMVRVTLPDYTWVPDTFDRQAFESPKIIETLPRLINSSGILYKHENGMDDDTSPMSISLSTKYFRSDKKDQVELWGMIPDSIQVGDIQLIINVKDFPQSTDITSYGPYTISPGTEVYNYTGMITGRYWQYVVTQSVLGGDWQAGDWLQVGKIGASGI